MAVKMNHGCGEEDLEQEAQSVQTTLRLAMCAQAPGGGENPWYVMEIVKNNRWMSREILRLTGNHWRYLEGLVRGM